MLKEYKGSCFCGAVTYQVSEPFKFIAHDHCSICRRTSGAAFVTWCGVKDSQFSLLSGRENLTTFKSTTEAERQFCNTCGSHLFFRSSRWPQEIHVTRATITSPIEEAPRAHVFFSDKADWCLVMDDLPKYGGKSGVEPLELEIC
jgi:hypothetical protein